MRELEDILSAIRKSVSDFENKSIGFTSDQTEILRDLGVNLFFLTDYKTQAFYDWNDAFINSVQKSDEKKQADAHKQHPEYFKICQIQKAGENVLQIIRTTISANK